MSILELKRELETQFTMNKLRALEEQAARIIQMNFKSYMRRIAGKPRNVYCQTEEVESFAFQKMSERFYKQLGSRRDLMTALKRSMFESYTLFYLAQRTQS